VWDAVVFFHLGCCRCHVAWDGLDSSGII
jgi:hypothetical protein